MYERRHGGAVRIGRPSGRRSERSGPLDVETSTVCYNHQDLLTAPPPSGTLDGVKPSPTRQITRYLDTGSLYKLAISAEKNKDYPTAAHAYDLIVKKATASRTASVQGMRTYGYHSWAQIGEVLDMSAQGAWEKYSHSGLVADPPDQVANRKQHPRGGAKHA